MTKKSMFNSPEFGKVVLSGLDWIDANAAECNRLKTETMDGHTLVEGSEVFSAHDPFYPVVIEKLLPDSKMCRIKCRNREDRRKKYTIEAHNKELFLDAKRAFELAIKKLDEKKKKLTCNINDAEKIIEQLVKERNELLNGWARVLNKENPQNIPWPMEYGK
jgi:hypothetical protein